MILREIFYHIYGLLSASSGLQPAFQRRAIRVTRHVDIPCPTLHSKLRLTRLVSSTHRR